MAVASEAPGGRVGRAVLAWVVGHGRRVWLLPLDIAFKTIGVRFGWLKALFASAPPAFLVMLGQLRAERAAWLAIRRVPAYRQLLEESGVHAEELLPLNLLEHLPETDKANYIDPYPIESRCVDGRFPFPGTMIDESSGSTGTPYNWIRSQRERTVAHRNIGFFARYAFGSGPLVTINAFSMGAWAAGFNMSLGMSRHGVVKSTGPDLDKIFSTLRYLGPRYRYLISGYPPFLKHLIDVGENDAFPFDDYELHALVGGEGMSEELRDYLLRRFRSVYSGYGATDIEIGMAAESAVSIAVRRLARARPNVRAALFSSDSRLPMVFQYNPLIHWLEVNDADEIVTTISRLDVLTPRIRYNVHDEGGLAGYRSVGRRLARFGFDIDRLGEVPDVAGPDGPLPWTEPIPLPFLWIHGRRDATISVMGANIYPEDIESIIYRDPAIARQVHSFLLTVKTDESATPRPGIALELADGVAASADWIAERAVQFADGLTTLNIDYRSSAQEYAAAMIPIVEAFERGAGPFAADAGRIKQRRILSA
jgi:phenylacetate-CoA ligase